MTVGEDALAGRVEGAVSAAAPLPWRRAMAWLAFLGPFFFLSYGLANWLAGQHAFVPSVVFGWESHIPFWDWTILPYWSIDLLYVLSLFVCASRSELDTHAKRLLTAQVIAVACFILFPLRFSFAHPATDGVWGLMFSALAQFDKPFNQLPSLHIALAAILWALYARKLSGAALIAMELWLLLVCGSVLTTYQHHFIDIPTGLLLGALCVWIWPFAGEGDGRPVASRWSRTHDPRRLRLAARYAAGSLILAAIGIAAGGWALWLLWASVSLLLVALAYAALGARSFQKGADGRLSVASRWLFAPYLVGAWINSRAWTWRDPRPVEIADGVFLGRVPTATELAGSSFKAVVDLTAEFDVRTNGRSLAVLPVLDLTAPSTEVLAYAAQTIERMRGRGPVLVCCALGCSRSACAVAAWLLSTGRARDVETAVAIVRAAREQVVLGPEHMRALAAMERS
jgi:protein-tyrosine phosphatase